MLGGEVSSKDFLQMKLGLWVIETQARMRASNTCLTKIHVCTVNPHGALNPPIFAGSSMHMIILSVLMSHDDGGRATASEVGPAFCRNGSRSFPIGSPGVPSHFETRLQQGFSVVHLEPFAHEIDVARLIVPRLDRGGHVGLAPHQAGRSGFREAVGVDLRVVTHTHGPKYM